MNTRILLRSQKNEILGILKNHGLDPAEFRWGDTPSDLDPDKIISRLVCQNTEFFYSFEMQGEAHFAIFSPAENSYIGTDYPGTWKAQCQCFSNWLQNLIKEINEPDLWEHKPNPETYQKKPLAHTYVAEPTSKSPHPDHIASRLDDLLEKNAQSISLETRSNTMDSPIRRYYGKA